MHIHVGSWKPISCSKCGSFKAVKPLNEAKVEVRCLDCGHEKLVPEPVKTVSWSSWDMPKPDENEQPVF